MRTGILLSSAKRLGFVGLLLGIPLALLYLMGTYRISRLETESHPISPGDPLTSFVSTRSGRVHVLDIGHGDVILLLHGSGRSVADWGEGFAERLARYHRVVAFDDYGFGLSDRNHGVGYGIALWARQAIDVLDALGVERTTIMGHSAGGAVAAILAADHPERVRAAVFVGHGVAMDPAQIVPLLPGVGEIWASRIAANGETFSERHRARLEAAYRIRGTRAALLTFIRRQYTIDGLRLLRGTYEDIQVPVLQVHGTLDNSISIDAARRLTRRLRDARFVAIQGVGHNVHADVPDRLASEIDIFTKGLAP